MAYIDEDLKALCKKKPDQRHQVVITLAEASQHLTAADLGLDEAEEIGDLGILKGTFTGRQLIEFSQRSEFEEITSDFDVSTSS